MLQELLKKRIGTNTIKRRALKMTGGDRNRIPNPEKKVGRKKG